ncbi:hypothetical protein QYM36_000807 [Artemia franciscana]|nr:hypothetical protein QYM36_000807 [Artemia franciscana]
MAKSLRSKWKQKMKAVKRVRYDAKATETLKKILAIQQIREQEEEAKKDAEMKVKANFSRISHQDKCSTKN